MTREQVKRLQRLVIPPTDKKLKLKKETGIAKEWMGGKRMESCCSKCCIAASFNRGDKVDTGNQEMKGTGKWEHKQS